MTGADAPETDCLQECGDAADDERGEDRPRDVAFGLSGDTEYYDCADHDSAKVNEGCLNACAYDYKNWWVFVGFVTDCVAWTIRRQVNFLGLCLASQWYNALGNCGNSEHQGCEQRHCGAGGQVCVEGQVEADYGGCRPD